MKIVVMGGTGYTGSAIVREAAQRDHAVISVSRRIPETKTGGVRFEAADVLRAEVPVAGADVVVGALSPRGAERGMLARAYARLAAQAGAAGARLVVVGGFSCLRREAGAPRMIEGESFPPEVPEEVVSEAKENLDVLNHLLADTTDLDWLFVSPGMHFGSWMPGANLGNYRVGGEIALFHQDGQSAISGIDFACAVVDEIEAPKYHRQQIGIAY